MCSWEVTNEIYSIKDLPMKTAVLGGWNTVYFHTQTPPFQRDLLPPSSRVMTEPEARSNTDAYLKTLSVVS
jgi:hypothetical protein